MFRRNRQLAAVLAMAMAASISSQAFAAPLALEGLSQALRASALQAMSPPERALRQDQFSSNRYSIVAYVKVVQQFDSASGRPVGDAQTLRIGQAAPDSIAGITNLVLGISVAYDNESPCCYWDIMDTFNWTSVPPSGNAGKDQMATAWANGLALISDSAYAVYTLSGGNVSMNRNDMTPNVGTDWEFSECKDAFCLHYADWGYLAAGIHETSRHGQSTNVVFKYFHTYQNLEYSVSFSGTGPSITISPTSGQTSTAVYATFTD